MRKKNKKTQKIIVGSIIAILLIGIISFLIFRGFVITKEIYQEDADATLCTGSWDASYPCSNVYDGNWNTYGKANFDENVYYYANYTKPANALNTSLWKVKSKNSSGDDVTTNISMNADCWSQTPLQFKVTSSCSDCYDGANDWFCWSGSVWTQVYHNYGVEDTDIIYEEAMIWKLE